MLVIAARIVAVLPLSLIASCGVGHAPASQSSCGAGTRSPQQNWCSIADKTVRRSDDIAVRDNVFRRIRVRWTYKCNPTPASIEMAVGLVGYTGLNGGGKEQFRYEKIGPPGRDV